MGSSTKKFAAIGFVLGGVGGALTGGFLGLGKDMYDAAKEAEEAAREAKRKARQARLDAMKDREVSSKGATNPRQIIYGTAKTGGQYAMMESSGKDSRYFHIVVVFAAHPCDSIRDVYFDDELALRWTGSGHAVTSKFAGLVDYSIQLGNQTAADPKAVSQTPSWTANDKLLGQTYLYVRLDYAEDKFSGIPNISAVVRGKSDIWDPRTDTVGWTDNHALCVLDYLMWSRGVNIPRERIDIDSFIEASNISDEPVSAGPSKTERRYTCNGTESFNKPPLEVLETLQNAGAMVVQRRGGLWRAIPGKYREPTIDLTADDLVGGLDFSPRAPKSGRFNVAKGTYIDPTQLYAAVDFVQLAVGEYIAEDLEEIEQSFDFPWTNSGTMARRLAKIYLEKTRYGLMLECTLKFRAMAIAPGTRVTLTVESLGWDRRIFRVEDCTISLRQGVHVVLREDDPAVWSWTETDALPVEAAPAVNLPDPFSVSPPVNVTVTEQLYTGLDGMFRNRAVVAWEAGGPQSRSFEVEFRSATDVSWRPAGGDLLVTTAEIDDLSVGAYRFRVRSRNGIGIASPWVEITYQLLGQANPPPHPTNVTLRNGLISWSYPSPPLDFKGFEVRYQPGTRKTWVDAIKLHEGYLTTTRLAANELPSGTVTILVRAVDWSGNQSESAYVTVGIGDPVVQNIVYEVSHAAEGWTGTVTGGEITPAGVVANEATRFWGEDSAAFWAPSANGLFWRPAWETLVYEWDFVPPAEALPAQLTIALDANVSGLRIEWIAPDRSEFWGEDEDLFWGADSDPRWAPDPEEWSEWPGADEIRNRQRMRFRVIVPSSQSGLRPTISDIRMILDVEDVTEVIEAFGVTGGETRLPITQTYRHIRVVSMTIHDDGSGAVTAKVVDKHPQLGPLIRALDEAGNPVETIIDARIQGY